MVEAVTAHTVVSRPGSRSARRGASCSGSPGLGSAALAAAALVALFGVLVFGAGRPGSDRGLAADRPVRVHPGRYASRSSSGSRRGSSSLAAAAAGQTEYRSRLPVQARPSGVMALPGDAAALRFHVDAQIGGGHDRGPAPSHPDRGAGRVAIRRSCCSTSTIRSPGCPVGVASRRIWRTPGRSPPSRCARRLVPDRGDNIQNWYAAYGTHDGGWADRQYTALLEQTRLSSSTHRTTISLSLDLKAAAAGDQSGRRRDSRRGGGVAQPIWPRSASRSARPG